MSGSVGFECTTTTVDFDGIRLTATTSVAQGSNALAAYDTTLVQTDRPDVDFVAVSATEGRFTVSEFCAVAERLKCATPRLFANFVAAKYRNHLVVDTATGRLVPTQKTVAEFRALNAIGLGVLFEPNSPLSWTVLDRQMKATSPAIVERQGLARIKNYAQLTDNKAAILKAAYDCDGGAPQQFICDLCGATCTLKTSLLQHFIQFHGIRKSRTFGKGTKCLFCDIKVKYLRQHVRMQHPDVQTRCSKCKKYFFPPEKLQQHIQSKVCDDFCVCPSCGVGFKVKRYLTIHQINIFELVVLKSCLHVFPLSPEI